MEIVHLHLKAHFKKSFSYVRLIQIFKQKHLLH